MEPGRRGTASEKDGARTPRNAGDDRLEEDGRKQKKAGGKNPAG